MQNLFSGATANGDSPIISVASISRGNYRTAKVDITGTATVRLMGRMSPADANWVELANWTASGIVGVILTPQVKFTISGASGANVNAWVDAYTA
jgi:hypothetical protein